MSYLLDANVFIQAKNLHYGLDFCPAFWQWLIDSHDGGRVFSIDKVAEEIATGADELTQWTQDHGGGLFRKTDAAVAANSVKRIKIPNVCIGLGLRFMTPYEMLRVEKAKFVLTGGLP